MFKSLLLHVKGSVTQSRFFLFTTVSSAPGFMTIPSVTNDIWYRSTHVFALNTYILIISIITIIHMTTKIKYIIYAYISWFFITSWSWSYGSWIYDYLCNQCLSPLTLWVRISLKRGVLNTPLCDKVCQWLSAGPWFCPGYSAFLHQ